MRIALVQMDVAYGDIEANHAKARAFIAEGLARGAELFVFPELWTTGFSSFAPNGRRFGGITGGY